MTFDSKASANRWLALCEADILRGTWDDPLAKGEPLGSYAARWIRERPGLSERSVRFYEGLLRLHIEPTLGSYALREVTPADVRAWRQGLLDNGVGESTVSKAYRFLRAVMNTAVDDEVIQRNPCRIKGAGVEHPCERPVLTVTEVLRLADSIEPRYRALVLLAVFGSLRWGELMGLRRSDLDLEDSVVRVKRAVSELGARQVIKTPKTAAGIRTVALPLWLSDELGRHLERFAEPGEHGRLFIGPKGATPLRANFTKVWARALAKAGLAQVHIHDLRHTGNHFAAMSGASLRELMGRMGHVSMDAALIYQHRTLDRDRLIADSLDAMLRLVEEQNESLASVRGGHAEGTSTD
jgi:integrase